MNRTKFRPTYSLDEAKSLACSGEMVVNGKVRRHLINHYGYLDIDRFLADLFDYLSPAISGNPSHSIWMGLCTMFTQTSMFVGILNVRIGTLSFQSILKARRI